MVCLGLFLLVCMLMPQAGMATEVQKEDGIIKPFMAVPWGASADEIKQAETHEPFEIGRFKLDYRNEIFGYPLIVEYKGFNLYHVSCRLLPQSMTLPEAEALRAKLAGHIAAQMRDPRKLDDVRSRASVDGNAPGRLVLMQDYLMDEHTVVSISYEWREHRNNLYVVIDMYTNQPDAFGAAAFIAPIQRKFNGKELSFDETAAAGQPMRVLFKWGAGPEEIRQSEGAAELKVDNESGKESLYYEKDFYGLPLTIIYEFGKSGLFSQPRLQEIYISFKADAFDKSQALAKIAAIQQAFANTMQNAEIESVFRWLDFTKGNYLETPGLMASLIWDADTFGLLPYSWHEEEQYFSGSLLAQSMYTAGAKEKYPLAASEITAQKNVIAPFMPKPWGSKIYGTNKSGRGRSVYYKTELLGNAAIIKLIGAYDDTDTGGALASVEAMLTVNDVTESRLAQLRAEVTELIAGQMQSPLRTSRESSRPALDKERPGNVIIFKDYLQDERTAVKVTCMWHAFDRELKIYVQLAGLGINNSQDVPVTSLVASEVDNFVKGKTYGDRLPVKDITFNCPIPWGTSKAEVKEYDKTRRNGVQTEPGNLFYLMTGMDYYYTEDPSKLYGYSAWISSMDDVSWERLQLFTAGVKAHAESMVADGREVYYRDAMATDNEGFIRAGEEMAFWNADVLYAFRWKWRETDGNFSGRVSVYDGHNPETQTLIDKYYRK